MTALDDQLARRAKEAPVSVDYDGETFVVRDTNAVVNGQDAFLEIAQSEEVVGFLIQYRDDEAGVLPAAELGIGRPTVVRSVEEAIDVLTGRAEGAGEPALA